VLELRNVFFTIKRGKEEAHLLEDVSLKVPRGHFMAIVGPSGCGKSTLLKTIAGINVESSGDLYWQGRHLSQEGDLEPDEFGYVPQFSIAYDQLTVEESIDNAIKLRLKTASRKEMEERADQIIEAVGLDAIRESRVSVLSGGQKRRLGLALEMATNPDLLLCDEVTSGLDPKSESEIVRLLHNLAKKSGRVVISVTHSLGNLDLYDSVLVMYEGRLVYHGPPRALAHYFGVEVAEEVYPQLAKRDAAAWKSSWDKHRAEYYDTLIAEEAPPAPAEPEPKRRRPGFFTQVSVLLGRRWKIFFRDRTQLILQLAMLIGFPLIVVLFAYDGVSDLKRPSESLGDNPALELKEQIEITQNRMDVGGLISGLIMFQVVLLALMGSNNSAREIAGERQIFEKEKLGGLGVMSYLASKTMFLSFLVIVQSVWMYLFVSVFAQMHTDIFVHGLLLILVNAAMTSICLGISASVSSPDQASLLSIYLVGFQLPLSGAILALPGTLEPFIQPFISAYWGWSGIVTSFTDGRYDMAIKEVARDTTLRESAICIFALGIHLLAGGFLALIGASKGRWSN